MKICLLLFCTWIFVLCNYEAYADNDKECRPSCRIGFICVDGTCVSECNPPCASDEKCVNKDCVKQSTEPKKEDPPKPQKTCKNDSECSSFDKEVCFHGKCAILGASPIDTKPTEEKKDDPPPKPQKICKNDSECSSFDKEVCFHGKCATLGANPINSSSSTNKSTTPINKPNYLDRKPSKHTPTYSEPPKNAWLALIIELVIGGGLGNFYSESYLTGTFGLATTIIGGLGIAEISDSTDTNIALIVVGAIGRLICVIAAPINVSDYNNKHSLSAANLDIWQRAGGSNRDTYSSSSTFYFSYPVITW